ncbi:hypothetical protein D770_04960 [Flammeovirgaceae bacterium 311]|nr:hypothetical protein D770_04960 [Flammeovirgaceae bacterium 311]
MGIETEKAVNQLYGVFSNYRLNTSMDASPLYDEEHINEWNRTVSSNELSVLTGEQLSLFVSKVCYTWGEINDFKHFLPRIFELIANYNEEPIEAWIAFDKLDYCDWKNWKPVEFKAVLDYLKALWLQLINDSAEAAKWKFSELFTSIAKVHIHPDWLLTKWKESENSISIIHYCEFIDINSLELLRRKRVREFKDRPDLSDRFVEWSKVHMKGRLMKIFESSDNEELIEKIIPTVEIIEKV